LEKAIIGVFQNDLIIFFHITENGAKKIKMLAFFFFFFFFPFITGMRNNIFFCQPGMFLKLQRHSQLYCTTLPAVLVDAV